MNQYHVLTLFPEMIENGLKTSITGRAIEQGIIGLNAVNIRDFADNKHNKVDDYPYGGGAGMVMQAEPVYRAWASVTEKIGKKARTIYVTPQGTTFNQSMAEELAKGGFLSTNAHKSIYVISPEFNNNSQIIFRDNLIPMIRDKHVMILMASVTTGRTLNKAVESIQYYGGILQGASAIFSAMDSLDGVPIKSVFGKKDLPDYTYSDYRDCPLCKVGKKIDALVNTFGYSPMG